MSQKLVSNHSKYPPRRGSTPQCAYRSPGEPTETADSRTPPRALLCAKSLPISEPTGGQRESEPLYRLLTSANNVSGESQMPFPEPLTSKMCGPHPAVAG